MKKTIAKPVSAWRFHLVLLVALVVLLLGRVLALQVLEVDKGYQFLKGQGEARAVRIAEIPAHRGMISDRRGEPLAVSTPVISLWVNPPLLAKQVARLPELAAALAIDTKDLSQRLSRYSSKRFMYLKRRMVPNDARRILDLGITGVYGQREYRRFYPAGEVSAHVVGMTNVDDDGISGLELAFDDWLHGVPGKKKVIKDLRGDVVRDIGELQAARPGRDLRLSIDLRLQYLQHRELQRAVAVTGAKAASVVTLDANTGEVLAMVNHPTYNPNNRQDIKVAHTRNRAIIDAIEPGSTVKPLTLAAALETGRYTKDTLIDTSPGRIRVAGKVIPDPRNYGVISLARVIEKSSQVGISKIALDIGHQPVWDVFSRLGLGQMPGTGFPGESAGVLPNRHKWHLTEQVTLAYGYGFTVTPLQLARAYSVFANGGIRHDISLLALDGAAKGGQRVMDAATAGEVLTVLQLVTGEHGTGKRAQVAGYRVGGKTGTVHKLGAKGYIDDKYIALFAGIAPINNPRVVTVVVIDEPKGDNYGGGSAAAPVFSRMLSSVLPLLHVVPDSVPEVTDSAVVISTAAVYTGAAS